MEKIRSKSGQFKSFVESAKALRMSLLASIWYLYCIILQYCGYVCDSRFDLPLHWSHKSTIDGAWGFFPSIVLLTYINQMMAEFIT
jgi:hypothetical protein